MNIGLIAHDNKKKLMENLCIAYRHILCKHDIYATGTTGRLVEEAANLEKLQAAAKENGWNIEVVCSEVDGQTFWTIE